jgi:hypothetical protein
MFDIEDSHFGSDRVKHDREVFTPDTVYNSVMHTVGTGGTRVKQKEP